MNKIKNQNGFTLISALVGLVILGIMALAVTSIADNVSGIIRRATAAADELMLIREIDMIMSNRNHCKMSLLKSDGNPIEPFTQQDHSELEQLLSIELWRSNSDGDTRVQKRFSATDPVLSKYGSLTIKSMGLFFPDAFSVDPNQDIFTELIIILERRQMGDKIIRYPLSINANVNGSGEASIVGCRNEIDNALVEANRTSCLQADMYWDENATPQCSESMGGPTNSLDEGGGGGEPVVFACPDGYVVTGFRGRSGSEIDKVGFRCHRFSFETMEPFGDQYFTKLGGGNGGSPFGSINCPAGKVAIGFRGRSGARIDKLGLVCGNIDRSNISFTAQRGGNGGSPFTVQCPVNTAIRSFYGRVGARVDALGVFCK